MEKKGFNVFVILIISYSSLFAQTEKGTFYVGGNTNIMFGFQDFEYDLRESNYNISSSLGVFIANNLLTGIDFSYSFEESIYSLSIGQGQIPSTGFSVIPINSELKTQEKSYLTSLFLKYYINLLRTTPFKFTINSQVGFGENSFRNVIDNEDYIVPVNEQNSIYSYKLGLGLSYFLKQIISLDLNVLYFTEYLVPKENGSVRDKHSISGFEPNIGLSFYF